MKTLKIMFSILLALAVVCSTSAATLADEAAPTITIKNENERVSMVGHTYNAYRVMDLSYTEDSVGQKHYAYTINSDFAAFFTGLDIPVMTDADAVAYIAEQTDMQAFAKKLMEYIKTKSIAPVQSAVAAAESVELQPDALGYYLILDAGLSGSSGEQAVVAALALTSTDYDTTIALKADAPSIEKKIVLADGSKADANTAAIGDTVTFEIASKVPDMTGYTKYFFVVNDKLSKGLTFKSITDITVGTKTLEAGTDYTLGESTDAEGVTSIEIVFKNFVSYSTGDPIAITYTAAVNQDAVIGVAGNVNEATLTYSNNPNVTPVGEDEPGDGDVTGETPKEFTKTYVTAIELTKVNGEGARLAGAEFELKGTALNTVVITRDVYSVDAGGAYYKLKNGTYTETAPGSGAESNYESTTAKYAKLTKTTVVAKGVDVRYTAEVGSDGVLRFAGLPAGTYTLTETKAPVGYNLLESTVTVTITCELPTSVSDGEEICTWNATGASIADGDGVAKLDVVNKSGSILPETGGIGTTIFYIAGSALVLGAIVLLVTRKRMADRD